MGLKLDNAHKPTGAAFTINCQMWLKVVYNPWHSHRVSPAIWNHTVLPATRCQWTGSTLIPATQDGTWFTYPQVMEGSVDLGAGSKPVYLKGLSVCRQSPIEVVTMHGCLCSFGHHQKTITTKNIRIFAIVHTYSCLISKELNIFWINGNMTTITRWSKRRCDWVNLLWLIFYHLISIFNALQYILHTFHYNRKYAPCSIIYVVHHTRLTTLILKYGNISAGWKLNTIIQLQLSQQLG